MNPGGANLAAGASAEARIGWHGLPAFVKGAVDRVLASLALIILSPVFAVFAIIIRIGSEGPAIFRQERVGKDGRIFTCVKFRTMRPPRPGDQSISLSEADPRITRFGHWLRQWSLDELPQLWNIARGEMSLVGPRPALPHQVARYSPDQRLRLAVKPGLTGWAQVNGRNFISWSKRIELDVWYARHAALGLDLRIVLRTLGVVVRREGLFGPGGSNQEF